MWDQFKTALKSAATEIVHEVKQREETVSTLDTDVKLNEPKPAAVQPEFEVEETVKLLEKYQESDSSSGVSFGNTTNELDVKVLQGIMGLEEQKEFLADLESELDGFLKQQEELNRMILEQAQLKSMKELKETMISNIKTKCGEVKDALTVFASTPNETNEQNKVLDNISNSINIIKHQVLKINQYSISLHGTKNNYSGVMEADISIGLLFSDLYKLLLKLYRDKRSSLERTIKNIDCIKKSEGLNTETFIDLKMIRKRLKAISVMTRDRHQKALFAMLGKDLESISISKLCNQINYFLVAYKDSLLESEIYPKVTGNVEDKFGWLLAFLELLILTLKLPTRPPDVTTNLDTDLDKSSVAELFTNCIENNCRPESLKAVADVLELTPAQRRRIGLDRNRPDIISSDSFARILQGFVKDEIA